MSRVGTLTKWPHPAPAGSDLAWWGLKPWPVWPRNVTARLSCVSGLFTWTASSENYMCNWRTTDNEDTRWKCCFRRRCVNCWEWRMLWDVYWKIPSPGWQSNLPYQKPVLEWKYFNNKKVLHEPWGTPPPVRTYDGVPRPEMGYLPILDLRLGYPLPPSWPGMGLTSPCWQDGVPPPPVDMWTDTQSENITFPHPSDAGGNNVPLILSGSKWSKKFLAFVQCKCAFKYDAHSCVHSVVCASAGTNTSVYSFISNLVSTWFYCWFI